MVAASQTKYGAGMQNHSRYQWTRQKRLQWLNADLRVVSYPDCVIRKQQARSRQQLCEVIRHNPLRPMPVERDTLR